MIDQSLTHPARTVPEEAGDLEHVSAVAARVLRGQDLYREHAADIRFEDGTWLVPSQHDATSVYEVTLGRRGEFCECRDFERRGSACKHVHAAQIARAKTARCAGCGARFPRREIVEVHEDHENLTWFVGDELCRSCGIAHGIL